MSIKNLDINQQEMVNGIIDLLKQVKDVDNRKRIADKTIKKFKKENIVFDYNIFLKKCGVLGKEGETMEMTDAGSSGGFEATLSHKETDVQEITDASSSGAFSDVPFGGKNTKGGRKNPLKIDGVKSIKNTRAVKDKKFPKWGGPDGVFVTIKDKCKKFPYCNQGDMSAFEMNEIEKFKKTIAEVSKETNIPVEFINEAVINQINKLFI